VRRGARGRLYVFLPPFTRIEDYLALVAAIERTTADLQMPLRLEGYPPPRDHRVKLLALTPDPGVIEVNIHPASGWRELVENTQILYEEARQSRLGTEKFMLDGRHTGTGGGNHVTLGAATPADSPWLRRPDLLKSLVTYWQKPPRHCPIFFPAPSSDRPARRRASMRPATTNSTNWASRSSRWRKCCPVRKESKRPWLVDRLLRNLLTDLTGNTHRAEFCIDKLYSPDAPTGRLGLVEFARSRCRPHAHMSLCQMLLLRALVARFWVEPYRGKLVAWGTQLHDRWMLPHFVAEDIRDVARDLQRSGFAFEERWLDPFVEFRFPRYGEFAAQARILSCAQRSSLARDGRGRSAGRDGALRGFVTRATAGESGRLHRRTFLFSPATDAPVPAHTYRQRRRYVGVRALPRVGAALRRLHPTIGIHAPLVFDLVDTWNNRFARRLPVPRGSSRRAQPRHLSGQRFRSGRAEIGAVRAHGAYSGRMEVRTEERNPSFRSRSTCGARFEGRMLVSSMLDGLSNEYHTGDAAR